jgi:PDDEXK-like domain of unknown function (DUF3799)
MLKTAKRIPGVTDSVDYHAPQSVERGDPKFVMSSSALRDFAECPDRWRADDKPKKTDAMDFGSLLDCRLLTPQLFNRHYVVAPATYPAPATSSAVKDGEVSVGDEIPWNGAAAYCKQWKASQDKSLEVVSAADMADIEFAIKRLNSKPTIKRFLECSDRQVMVTAEWHDEKTGLIIPFKVLIDLLPRVDSEFGKNVGDLKSTRSAALVAFAMDCFKRGYHVQAALYRDVYQLSTRKDPDDEESGEDRCNSIFLLAENIYPFQPGKRILSQDFLTLGRATYRMMLENYCQCVKAKHWPDYDETDEAVGDWSSVEAMPFMAERAAFAPRFNFDPETAVAEMPDSGDLTP